LARRKSMNKLLEAEEVFFWQWPCGRDMASSSCMVLCHSSTSKNPGGLRVDVRCCQSRAIRVREWSRQALPRRSGWDSWWSCQRRPDDGEGGNLRGSRKDAPLDDGVAEDDRGRTSGHHHMETWLDVILPLEVCSRGTCG